VNRNNLFTITLLLFIMAVNAVGFPACGFPPEENDAYQYQDSAVPEDKPDPGPIPDKEAASATYLDPIPGDEPTLIKFTDHDAPRDLGGGIEQSTHAVTTPTFTQNSPAPPLQGQFAAYSVYLDIGDTVHTSAYRTAGLGDIDLYLYRGLNTLVKSSKKAGSFVDKFDHTATVAGTYFIRFHCVVSPCTGSLTISRGNDTGFQVDNPVFVNQRGFTTVNNKCCFLSTVTACNQNAAWRADGECMCSSASGSMGIVAVGKVQTSQARNVASALFTTNTSIGAANRAALMAKMSADYQMTCAEQAMTWAIYKAALRAGKLVLLRSSGFSSSGHYTRALGWTGANTVIVSDPYGVWSHKAANGLGVWNPANNTNPTGPGSYAGARRSYNWNSLVNGGSLIVCVP
jgi:hypothetical protein